MTYARTREPYLYTRAYERALLISVSTPFVIIDNQLLTEKMMLYNIFLAQKFGRSKKKQYLCTRFAPEVSESQKWQQINLKNVMLKISHLQRKCKVF